MGLTSRKDHIKIDTEERCVLRRLYSTFAGGWPGVGLVLMRIVAGFSLASGAASGLMGSPAMHMSILFLSLAMAAILLVVGLYTPIVGTLVALVESCRFVITPTDKLVYLLIATLGAALAMLGPGLWSIDARLFGWKRIEPSPRKR